MVKRLLCLVSCMNAGGAETFLMKLYRKIDREKYQMDFGVFTEKHGFYDTEIERLGGKIYHLTPKTENFSLYKKELYNLILKEKYEYVLRITSNAAGFYDLKVAKSAGARVCIARSSNSSDGDSWKVKVINFISRFLYQKFVDVKIAPSDLAAAYTFGKQSIARGEVYYLNNGLDLNVYRFSSDARNRIRAEFNLQGKFVIGHIGRFFEQKNHAFLIDVFYEIKKEKDNAVLLLVGEGDLRRGIEEKVKKLGLGDSVIFTGIRKDIPALLSAMDIFVFPSLYEGMPNTVIEAQATGLPCVIADTITREAGITDLVHYKSLKASPKEWAEEVLAYCNGHNENRELYSEKLKDAGYDIDACTNKFVEIIFGEINGIEK